MWTALALAVGITLIASGQLDDGRAAGDQVVGGGTTGSPSATDVPGPGQVRVQGTVTVALLTDAVPAPRVVSTPLTVMSDRGFGNGGQVTGVEIGDETSEIVWDGGRPFELSGAGGITIDPVTAELVPDGIRLVLGGATHRFVPGTYRLDTPVAVGTSGVATPRDSVSFDASDRTLLSAKGDASLLLDPKVSHQLRGPGRVHLEGVLELTDAAGTRSTTSLTVDRAAFELTFSPDGAGGWTVAGLVDASNRP